ncbi:unnamed protein product, partial [Closterium sp. Naga37s-1]
CHLPLFRPHLNNPKRSKLRRLLPHSGTLFLEFPLLACVVASSPLCQGLISLLRFGFVSWPPCHPFLACLVVPCLFCRSPFGHCHLPALPHPALPLFP